MNKLTSHIIIFPNNYMKLKIVKSHLANKKLDAIFTYDDGKTKTIPFGAANFLITPFTMTKIAVQGILHVIVNMNNLVIQ